jgi:hypothetical protein
VRSARELRSANRVSLNDFHISTMLNNWLEYLKIKWKRKSIITKPLASSQCTDIVITTKRGSLKVSGSIGQTNGERKDNGS